MNRPGRPISIAPRRNTAKTQSQVMEDWGAQASLLVKRAMSKRGWGYGELAAALSSRGISGSAALINRRINRGSFSAGFLLACLEALGERLKE